MSSNVHLSDLPWLLRTYIKIRQWFQPYYRYRGDLDKYATGGNKRPKTRGSTKPVRKKKKSSTAKRKKTNVQSPASTARVVGKNGKVKKKTIPATTQPRVKVIDSSQPLTRAIKSSKKPGPNTIWCFHNKNYHQVFARLEPGSGFVFTERDNAARKELKPNVFPKQNKPFDRTHLIPIGYHGSENDKRLLIGWDSDVNRGPFNDFEQKQKRRRVAIYWLTSVTRQPYGARWDYRIYDASTGKLLDKYTDEQRKDFVWKD